MKQVLVVDDSPVIRKIARRILEGMNLSTCFMVPLPAPSP
jgi:CheY-like chemotaxis protein